MYELWRMLVAALSGICIGFGIREVFRNDMDSD